MSPLVAVVAAAAVFEAARGRLGDRRAGLVGGGVIALVWQPPLGAAAALVAGFATVYRRLVRRRRSRERAAADVPLLAELTLLGLTAGLPFAAALAAAADEVDDRLGADVRRVLRRARRTGLGVALQTHQGPAAPFLRLAARATETGAPLAAAVAAYVDEAQHAERAVRMAAARKLPVRLLLPLALLILPGFVLLTMGPALLGALDRLDL